MTSFLQLLAKDMIDKYGYQFRDLIVIFPNKRAGLFLAEELSKQTDHPIWMPEILTLTEYIEKHTGLKKADPLSLIIKLYKSYTKVAGSTEKFEDFYFWGNMLLSDFDDIDKYLVDAQDLFSNLIALKELELRFPYLTEEQISVIQKFWNSFHPEKYSIEQQEFLKIWNNLWATYADFKFHLLQAQICYEGMNERYFCEHLSEYTTPEKILIAGFNALNSCEKQIFSYYRDAGCASFYWDYDLYYTTNKHQEAGLYLRENLKHFPNELKEEHFNHFLYHPKEIEYISVPSTIGQVKLLSNLTEHLKLKEEEPRHTAIVLCDEQMLIPVMYSLPTYIQKINITMGHPAHTTSIATLFSLLSDLKNYAKQEHANTCYYYKPVIAILNHKLIKDLFPEEIHKITQDIHKKNIIYLTEKSLHFHPLTQAIFSSQEKIPTYLLKILQLFIQILPPNEHIEKEFIFSIYTQIQNLQNTFEEEQTEPEDKLYLQIINKVIRNITVPFSGEPLEGIQVMGLMETRMLDFKHLIILSANEGILPKTTLPSSFIPYHLRLGFRLPTPEHQDALFAYYFYRLLQRAQNIKILYTSGIKGMNGGEMSRFLYQIKYESGLSIRETNFQNQISTPKKQTIIIPKTENILNILRTFQQSEEKTLSPSALNTYLDCSLKFYLKYIAQIKEKEEITEELDHRLLGNIFHECSQSLYAMIAGNEITTQNIDKILQNDALIDTHIRHSYHKIYATSTLPFLDHSNNQLILNIVKKYIKAMFQYDKKICPFHLIAMENRFYVPVTIDVAEKKETVFIGGFIDRIDQTNSGIRVIDYKTGSDTTTFKNMASIFDSANPTRNKAAFQTMLYALMYDYINPGNLPLIPGIYNTKLLFQKDYDYHLKCDREIVNNFRHYEKEYREALKAMLEDLFSPSIPFSQTPNPKKCKNCSYLGICRKS